MTAASIKSWTGELFVSECRDRARTAEHGRRWQEMGTTTSADRGHGEENVGYGHGCAQDMRMRRWEKEKRDTTVAVLLGRHASMRSCGELVHCARAIRGFGDAADVMGGCALLGAGAGAVSPCANWRHSGVIECGTADWYDGGGWWVVPDLSTHVRLPCSDGAPDSGWKSCKHCTSLSQSAGSAAH
jgi:hypothetical protein